MAGSSNKNTANATILNRINLQPHRDRQNLETEEAGFHTSPPGLPHVESEGQGRSDKEPRLLTCMNVFHTG
jgi:hypothetical protein